MHIAKALCGLVFIKFCSLDGSSGEPEEVSHFSIFRKIIFSPVAGYSLVRLLGIPIKN